MLDINKLKVRDLITFGEQVTKRVSSTYRYSVSFDDGAELHKDDVLWRIARLGRAKLPDLKFGVAVDNEEYRLPSGYAFTPETFLRALKEDVAALESVGVKEDEN